MDTFYLVCAVLGGTVLVCQFALTITGLSGDTGDVDAGIDIPDATVGGDTGHSGDATGGHYDTVWFFKVITLQTMVAAITFFGIGGRASSGAGFPPGTALVIAIGSAIAAMYLVYFLLTLMHRFNADGTIRIQRALGAPGTVYIPIPAARGGAGKVHVHVQNRLLEFQAVTDHERLPTGSRVRVVGIQGPDTLEVELVSSEA